MKKSQTTVLFPDLPNTPIVTRRDKCNKKYLLVKFPSQGSSTLCRANQDERDAHKDESLILSVHFKHIQNVKTGRKPIVM